MESAVVSQAFNSGNFGAVRLDCEDGAGFYRLSVNVDRACAADGCFTADVCACQSRKISDEVNQQEPWFYVSLVFCAVDGKRNLHALPPELPRFESLGERVSDNIHHNNLIG
jgi:hypothetical protein